MSIQDSKNGNSANSGLGFSSESDYHDLYHQAPDMMMSVNPFSREIIRCNETLCKRLGYGFEELVGNKVGIIFHADSMQEVQLTIKEFLTTGAISNRRLILVTKGGEKINIAINSQAIRGENEEILYSNSVLREIDDIIVKEEELNAISSKYQEELNATKTFLQKVTDIAPSIIYVFDHETMGNNYTNREIGEVLGFSGEEVKEMGDQLMPLLCHEDDLGLVYEHFGNIKNLKDDVTISLEYRMKHKKGGFRYLLSEDTVFERNAKGKVIKHLGVATDISEIKENEIQLRQQGAILKTQNEDLKQFAYVATHDMKGPLYTIAGHFDYLKSQFESPTAAVKESVSFIDQEVSNLKTTIAALSDAIEIREADLKTEPVDLNVKINKVLKSFRKQIEKLGGKFNIVLSEKSEVMGNKMYLRSILNNLISNSLKYRAEDRALIVNITTKIEGDSLLLSIEDNGMGIDVELHEDRLFKMFNRFHTESEGTGMGLYMVKSMVEKLGASITIESQVGVGTKFNIYFKLIE